MSITTFKWSIERYHRAIEAGVLDDQLVELLRGEIVTMPPEGEAHAYYNTEVADYLRSRLGSQAKIRDAKPITLPDDSEPSPDIAIVQPLGTVYLEHHPYPGNIFWLIEFANTTLKKDLGIKKDIYASAGIPEYWVINLSTSELIIFRELRQGSYQQQTIVTEGFVQALAFPGILIDVQQLLYS